MLLILKTAAYLNDVFYSNTRESIFSFFIVFYSMRLKKNSMEFKLKKFEEIFSSFFLKNFPKIKILTHKNVLKSLWSSGQCDGLLDEKPGFEPQARHQNKIRKVFLRLFPLSRFLAKTLMVFSFLPKKCVLYFKKCNFVFVS